MPFLPTAKAGRCSVVSLRGATTNDGYGSSEVPGPVARGSLQHLVGVAHIRDLFALDREGADTAGSASRAAPMVPPAKPLGALMRELREQRQHMAFVGDEYGGLLGS